MTHAARMQAPNPGEPSPFLYGVYRDTLTFEPGGDAIVDVTMERFGPCVG